jgi:hypothetical protein
MFHLIFKKYFKSGTIHIFIFSFIVFIVLNVVENVIHYNIGKFHDHDGRGVSSDSSVAGYHFTNPSNTDWVRIIVIMLVFAILQGVFTSHFSVC